jgi:hypothetical protein
MARIRYLAVMESVPGKAFSSRPLLTCSDPVTVARCLRVLTDSVTRQPGASASATDPAEDLRPAGE